MLKSDNITILIVEDDPDILALWELEFALEFSHVISACDGQQAISILEASKPDLILSDIMLPKLDGFGLCNQIKSNPLTSDIPIVLFSSTYLDQADEALALDYGAAAVLNKKDGPALVIKKNRDVLSTREVNDQLMRFTNPANETVMVRKHLERVMEKMESLPRELRAEIRQLRNSLSRFKDFAACLSDHFWETDKNGQLKFMVSGEDSSLDLPTSDAEGRSFSDYFSRQFKLRELLELEQDLKAEADVETVISSKSGLAKSRVIQVAGKPYFNHAGQFNGHRGVLKDITETHHKAERLRHEATHDPLTNLPNKRALEQHFVNLQGNEVVRAQHVLCFLDLDFFKAVNDTAGHKAGDELLIQISGLLAKKVRRTDLLARIGGDEFVVLMPNCTIEQAQRLVKSIHETINNYRFVWESRTYQLGVSIGVHSFDASSVTLDKALSEADKACYTAKQSGGNQIHVQNSYVGEIPEALVKTETIEKINHAFAHDGFSLFKQVITHTGDDSIPVAYEVLLRLNDGETQLLPASLIPVIQRYQLSPRLDQWVISHVIAWMEDNTDELDSIDFLSVNLSPSSISDDSFREWLGSYMRSQPVLAKKLCFEITENAAIENLSDAKELFHRLRSFGCKIALDDFGTGFSSLAYLKNLPVDFIKIDGMFITGVTKDPVDYRVLCSIQQLAELLDIKTIAEFVENEATARKLNQIGVNMTQGYYIGRPEVMVSS